MRAYLTVVLALIGVYVFFTRYFHFGGVMEFARKHRHPDWTPRIEYLVAMTYYQRSDYGEAEQAFTQLLTDYPTCQYAPKALLRLGLSAEELHHWEKAREVFTRYLEEFPEGKDAKAVQKNLDMVRNRQ